MAEDDATLEPHMALSRNTGNRYPNPFFDLGQQYAPRTVKELFKWCTYFYYTNPLINSTVTKISRYPITDLIIEDGEEKVKKLWKHIFNDVLHIKDRLMEVNLDQNVYGNSIVSIYFPFTRYLVCAGCNHRVNIKETKWKFLNFNYNWKCPKCKKDQSADTASNDQIKDIPYRSADDIKIIRWNPENIAVRYNEATAESHYYYSVSRNLRMQIQSGEREIIESLPLLFLQAVKKNRLIKLSNGNIFHLKKPTLAEKDMGWGKPLIQPVMKDLYYMATLRKAQEAIAQEHIVPFDFLYPTPNAQMDPFVHSDLGNWKMRVEEAIKTHRKDVNYKAVLPVPVGFGRLGGDGKMLLLTPEINTLTQQIVGGMGIPQEFIFGGLNWTGSSVTLRALQNDFLHNQTQLLDLTIWIKNRVRTFLRITDIQNLRFLDFKMADDIQRRQQILSLNAQRKISDETLLTEFGLDYTKETAKILKEITAQNEIQDIMARSQAKTSGEAQIISYNYQQKLQELQENAQKKKMQKEQTMNSGGALSGEQSSLMSPDGMPMPNQGPGGPQPGTDGSQAAPDAAASGQAFQSGAYSDAQGDNVPGAAPGQTAGGDTAYMDIHKTVRSWANKLVNMDPNEQLRMLTQIKQQMPEFGKMVEQQLNELLAGQANAGAPPIEGGASSGGGTGGSGGANMTKMPEKGAPRRAGGAG